MDGYLNAVRVEFIIRIHTQVPAIKPVISLLRVLVFGPSGCCSFDSNIQVCCLCPLQVTSKETETGEKRQQIRRHNFHLLRIKTFCQLWKTGEQLWDDSSQSSAIAAVQPIISLNFTFLNNLNAACLLPALLDQLSWTGLMYPQCVCSLTTDLPADRRTNMWNVFTWKSYSDVFVVREVDELLCTTIAER